MLMNPIRNYFSVKFRIRKSQKCFFFLHESFFGVYLFGLICEDFGWLICCLVLIAAVLRRLLLVLRSVLDGTLLLLRGGWYCGTH